jgi:hypothetical protein
MKLAIIAFIPLSMNSCSTSGASKEAPAKHPVSVSTPSAHRFQQSKSDMDLAFDQQTGQLCKTWDWYPATGAAKPLSSGMTPQRQHGEFAPLCVSVYRNFPSSVATDRSPSESAPD